MKYILILALGIAMGYGYGWTDAQKHSKHVVSRLVDRVGGSNRDAVRNDIDGRMDRASK